jgi:glycosyltransferase involved in cell wall biosynthesis
MSYLFKKYPDFNYDEYKSFYSDLKDLSHIKLIQHYDKFGRKEGRVYNKTMLNTKHNLLTNQLQLSINNIILSNKSEQLINILIRTSNRESYFKKCINSILNQKYSNYKIIICYDKDDSLKYLTKFNNSDIIEYYKINIESVEKYKFNLYCNSLLQKVKNGWIIFLDDDDVFTSNNSLSYINNKLEDIHGLYLWKFFRPDKIIFPADINNIKLGEIDTTSFCFHSNNKLIAKWDDKQYGDYRFFKQLEPTLNKYFIEEIITKTSYNNIISNCGRNTQNI